MARRIDVRAYHRILNWAQVLFCSIPRQESAKTTIPPEAVVQSYSQHAIVTPESQVHATATGKIPPDSPVCSRASGAIISQKPL
jgi:hypothetical protein